jgi:SecD/SecF fusion protein
MFTLTVALTIMGAALFFSRGKEAFDIDFNGGTAYTGRLTEQRDMAWLKGKLDGCKLPEMKLEQIFVSDSQDSSGDKSRFFTVRTGESDTRTVGAEVSRLLGSDLQKVQISKLNIEKGPGGLVTGADLEFTAAVSPDQVSRIVRESLRSDGLLESAAKEMKQSVDVTRTRTQDAARQMRVDVKGKAQAGRYQNLKVVFNDPLEAPIAEAALKATQTTYNDNPQPERLDNFSGSMAKATQGTALAAIVASWIAIVFYLWLRFGNWTFGLAALLCLVHDLFFTLGIIAACHFLSSVPVLSSLLQIQDFKIDLPAVAALLTLVGYSVNDTIVVFDRIREVRGRNPLLNERMINESINQTLSRTVWASFTTWLVVLVLYFSGAEGIHLFAFVMVVGVVIGTISSIYIASPLLLILGEGRQNSVIEQERSLADEMSTT